MRIMKGLSKEEYGLMKNVNLKYNKYYCYRELKTKRQILEAIRKSRTINCYDVLMGKWELFYKGKRTDDSCS